MSSMAMVRHAQASFLSGDYDRLSSLGAEQARRLGRYWSQRGISFDLVFCGPRRRQRETEQIVGREMKEAGQSWPAAQTVEGLDEYPAESIMRAFAPQVVAADDRLKKVAETFNACQDAAEKQRLFQRLFEPVTRRWLAGELSSQDVESWKDFRTRVLEAVESITTQAGRGSRVAVFTSAGPIAVAVERALGHPTEKTLELSWTVRNAAHSEFLFTQDRFSLSTFNTHPHLDEPRLVTFR
ncbi:MAG TPA: histidine phosphatase family protein [Acidobacteriota bacterium]|nr:histidine phosphatase family protein [Acidobacteriota bacterium]